MEDSKIWHAENLKRNYQHYSFLRWFGPSVITNVQENYGGSIYYNTNVLVENQVCFHKEVVFYHPVGKIWSYKHKGFDRRFNNMENALC